MYTEYLEELDKGWEYLPTLIGWPMLAKARRYRHKATADESELKQKSPAPKTAINRNQAMRDSSLKFEVIWNAMNHDHC